MLSRPKNSDFQSSTFGRRATDAMDHEPTLRDIYQLQLETRDHLSRIDSAFVRDDLQQPDYAGHRRWHRNMLDTSNTLEKFKMDAAMKVVGVLAVFLIGLLGSGLAEWVKGMSR